MLNIRQAVPEDLPAIVELYDGVIDLFQAQTGNVGWRRGVYPTETDFQKASKPARCTWGSWRAGWPPE